MTHPILLPLPADVLASLQPPTLGQVIDRLHTCKVLVVGDLAIDDMIYGQVDRLSREAPVVILRHHHTDTVLGAAANAAHNLAKLGAHVTVAGVLGADYYADTLRNALHRDGLHTDGLVVDEHRPTTTKTRISGMVNQSITQQVVRLDRESREPLSAVLEGQLLAWLEANAHRFDALLLSDYGLGVVTPAVIEACRRLTQQLGLLWAVDSQRPLSWFAGAAIMTPNLPEAEANLPAGTSLATEEALLTHGPTLLTQSGGHNLLITRGSDGMALFEGGEAERVTLLPVFNQSHVFDVTGAGDTVVATLLLAKAVGASWCQAAVLGNLAASLVVRQFGAATTTQAELHDALVALPPECLSAIQSAS
jgi:rfaE bifunctional protein kinase chain/domain